MNRYKPVGWRGESHRHYLAAKGIKTRHDSPLSMTKFLENAKTPSTNDEEFTEDKYFSIASQSQTAKRDEFYASKISSMFKNEEGVQERESLRQQDIQRKRADVVRRLDSAVDQGELTAKNREWFVEDKMSSLNKQYANGIIDKETYDKDMEKILNDFLSIHSRKFKVFEFGQNT